MWSVYITGHSDLLDGIDLETMPPYHVTSGGAPSPRTNVPGKTTRGFLPGPIEPATNRGLLAFDIGVAVTAIGR